VSLPLARAAGGERAAWPGACWGRWGSHLPRLGDGVCRIRQWSCLALPEPSWTGVGGTPKRLPLLGELPAPGQRETPGSARPGSVVVEQPLSGVQLHAAAAFRRGEGAGPPGLRLRGTRRWELSRSPEQAGGCAFVWVFCSLLFFSP